MFLTKTYNMQQSLFAATLIFNPLAYAIQDGVGWRITYSIYAVLVFVVGSALTLTFIPREDQEFKVRNLHKFCKWLLIGHYGASMYIIHALYSG